jgi:predicted cupin superfamily sugar epimerase
MKIERDGPGPTSGAAGGGPPGSGDPPDTADTRLEGLSALEVAVALGMQPHREGGYFRETYRSPLVVDTEAGPRPLSTAILYLLTTTDPSRFHRLRSDELWLYHAGAPAELALLGQGMPEYQAVYLNRPQAFVPADRWMAARVITEDEADWGSGRAPERRWTVDRRATHELRWTLVSCVVTPGFEYDDFESGEREALLREFPRARKVILALT